MNAIDNLLESLPEQLKGLPEDYIEYVLKAVKSYTHQYHPYLKERGKEIKEKGKIGSVRCGPGPDCFKNSKLSTGEIFLGAMIDLGEVKVREALCKLYG